MTGPTGAGLGAELAEAAPWVERLARVGYAAKGVVYLLIGILAARTAFGDSGGQSTGSSGALRTLVNEPFGQILLGLLAAGLAAYALWRAFAAITDPENHGTDAKGIAVRVGFAASALVHGGLALEAFRLATGSGGGSGDGAEHWTARLLAAPAGPYLVGAVGLAIGIYGLAQLARAFGSGVTRRLGTAGLDPDHRRWIERIGRFGLAARGVIFALIAFFVLRAAFQYDPSEAGGVDQALEWLAARPWANVLFIAVALGLVAYGVFQLVKAKYRIISAY